MGYMTFHAPCIVCGRVFSFHPNLVPSIRGEPICQRCMRLINDARIKRGLKPIPILKDAYKEVLDEEEDRINWGD